MNFGRPAELIIASKLQKTGMQVLVFRSTVFHTDRKANETFTHKSVILQTNPGTFLLSVFQNRHETRWTKTGSQHA
jgi:hypothetical protein